MRLTDLHLSVLRTISRNPGRTAHELGRIMFRCSNNPMCIELPHKVMVRLERAGWVERVDSPMICVITEVGKKVLKGVVK